MDGNRYGARKVLWLVSAGIWIVGLGCGNAPTTLADDGVDPPPPPPADFVPAFPGAEGFGAGSVGGRGGTVIPVTNLDDDGPGSLRAAVETPGPRTIVFHTGGTITLQSPLEISEPFVTVAGQTAPGDGIALRGDGGFGAALLRVTTHDVILRHLRLRPGSDELPDGSCCRDALSINGTGAFNIMVDHVSLSWGVDEVAEIFNGPRDVTIQWSILAEGLSCSNHEKTVSSSGGGGPCPGGAMPHSRGMTISAFPETGTAPDRLSLHHNLFAHAETRFPNVTSSSLIDIVNNVMYDFQRSASLLGLKDPGPALRLNYVANVYRPGPTTLAQGAQWALELDLTAPQDDAFEIYWEGNEVSEPIVAGWEGWEAGEARHRVMAAHEVAAVTSTSAQTAFDAVLAEAGATLPARDPVDSRIVAQVTAGTGDLVDHPSDVGGWPTLAPGAPPTDTDADGMPDVWESSHELDPSDASDGPADADADGWTNLEEYLNGTDPRRPDR